MTLAWSTPRDALTVALATAAQGDRDAVVALRDSLTDYGAAYDAAIAAGTLSPAAGTTLATITTAQRTAALAALQRAVRSAEQVAGASMFTPWRYTDAFTSAGETPTANAAASGDGLRVVALTPGADGNRVSVRLSRAGDYLTATERYDGRDGTGAVARLGAAGGETLTLVLARVAVDSPHRVAVGTTVLSLAGGTGGTTAATLARARAALGHLDASAAVTINAARLDELIATVEADAPDDGPRTLERSLASAMDDATALLAYLGVA